MTTKHPHLAVLKEPTYLGDGAYAGHDGFQAWVWTSNGITESKPIALEPDVLISLIEYAKRVGVLS